MCVMVCYMSNSLSRKYANFMKRGSDDTSKQFFFFPLQLSLSLDLKWKSWLDGGIYKGFPALYKQNHPTMILNLARGKEAEDMEYYFTPRNVVL